MHETMKNFIRQLRSDRKKQRKLAAGVCALSLAVACGVFWQLRITGITMSDTACCGMEEHVHDEDCFEEILVCELEENTEPEEETLPPEPQLICGLDEHLHGDECYTTETVQICEESHEHDDSCWEAEQVLVCEIEDEEHEHKEGCWEEQKTLICTWEHTHDESCFEEQEVLSCTLPEHSHDEGCYEVPETKEPRHVHSEDCYEIVSVCGYDEEHEHTLECYSDPDADVESPGDWESTLPGLTGKREHDLMAVARSQAGYRESDDNFIVTEDGGSRMGITRYGQWYGNPYGEWNAMFVTFCLRYAGIGSDVIPGNSGCYAWTAELSQWGLLRSPGSYSPDPGDLVFFDWDGDGAADHVGIVTKTNSHSFKTIEGGRDDCVASYEYSLGDGAVCGFVRITEKADHGNSGPAETTEPTEEITQPTEETTEATEETTESTEETTEETTESTEETTEATEETTESTEETTEATEETTEPSEPEGKTLNVTVYEDETCTEVVEGAVAMSLSGLLPEGAEARAYPVEAVLEGREILFAFHIGVYDADGELLEFAEDPVALTMTLPQFYHMEENSQLAVFSLPEGGAQEIQTEGENLTFAIANDQCYGLVLPAADDEPQQTTLPLAVYEDETCTKLMAGASEATVSGILPGGCTARAYPMAVNLPDMEILRAFHIGVYAEDGTLLELTQPLTVTIREPRFEIPEEDLSQLAVYMVPVEAPGEEVPSQMTGGNLLFEAVSGQVYAAVLPKARLQQTTLVVQFYEDGTYTRSIAEAPEMTLTGLLPENATVRAYLAEAELPGVKEVLFAFHLAVFTEEGDLWVPEEPREPLIAGIQLPQLYAMVDNTVITAYQIAEDGEIAQIPTQLEEGMLTFAANGPAVYAAASRAATLRDAIAEGLTEYQLHGDEQIDGETLLISSDFKLDLNGYTLTAETDGPLFTVAGGNLEITDTANSEAASTDSLSYSVTTTTVIDRAAGSTEENGISCTDAIYGHIIGGGITVQEGGTFTLSGGAISDCAGPAVTAEAGSTVQLDEGYIYRCEQAVYASGAAVTMDGDVVLAHHTNSAVYLTDGATLNLHEGIIAENESMEHGGGVYCQGSTINMDGGYITNNTVADSEDINVGGGGVYLIGPGVSQLNLNGGFITGNTASTGGGIATYNADNQHDHKIQVHMSGGFVSGNTSTTHEGGGMALRAQSDSIITGGYITNNQKLTASDWGGGGIFCSEQGVVTFKNAVIYNNTANGLGGGVTGCPTGTILLHAENGAAIFGNTDYGRSTADSNKGDDVEAINDPVFMAGGHKDYYCAKNSVVYGGMLGGGSSNWSGTADDKPVTPDSFKEPPYFVVSEIRMGLDAHPTDEDLANALYQASSQGGVYINGNYSFTHGGGVLCNGMMVFGSGDKIEIEEDGKFNLLATKNLLNAEGESVELEAGAFTFDVTIETENGTEVITTATNDENGRIVFPDPIPFSDQVVTVYIQERPGDDLTCEYDSRRYKLVITPVAEVEDTGYVKRTKWMLNKAELFEILEDGTENSRITIWNDSEENRIFLGNMLVFNNVQSNQVKLKIHKEWEDDLESHDPITIYLRNTDTRDEFGPYVLGPDNDWTQLIEEELTPGRYIPVERPVPSGYRYKFTLESSTDEEIPARFEPATEFNTSQEYYVGNPDASLFLAERYTSFAAFGQDQLSAEGVHPMFALESGNDGYFYLKHVSTGKYLSLVKYTYNSDSTPAVVVFEQGIRSPVRFDGGYIKAKTINQNGLALSDPELFIHSYEQDGNKKIGITDSVDANTFLLYTYVPEVIIDNGDYTFNITNTPMTDIETYGFDVHKVDAGDHDIFLPGAIFRLSQGDTVLSFMEVENGRYVYQYVAEEQALAEILDPAADDTLLVTDADGRFHVEGLPEGTYTLTEVQTPEGYTGTATCQIILPAEDGANPIVVENTLRYFELPKTGGVGTNGFTLLGVLLMAAAGGLWIFLQKRNREEGSAF